MNAQKGVPKKKGYIKSSTLILLAFATAFFPRILDTLGAPSPVNFAHFAFVPFACGFALAKSRTKNRNQILISKMLLSGILVLFGVITASALVNNAGLSNLILEFLLLAEPFILLLAIVCIPMSQDIITRFRRWIIGFSLFHIGLALTQKLLLDLGIMRPPPSMGILPDNVQGVFYLSGSGHVVGASVSITFGLYYLISASNTAIWLRASVFFAAFLQLLSADAKQVLLVALVSWVILILVKLKDIGKTLQYVTAAIVVGYVLLWCMENVEAFRAFNTWVRPEIYGPEGEATLLKTAAFRIIHSYYESSLNWLFGIGPGHTVGRLGGWMLGKYQDLLAPIGVTIHPASEEAWDAVWASWLGPSSSMFSPLFGWAGIWGDIGFLGLASYLYLWSIVWCRLCFDDFSRFMILNVLVHGFIFTQMEEPGYMLFIAVLIGLRWQEKQSIKRLRHFSIYPVVDSRVDIANTAHHS
jgi:hypothetical protein